MEGLPKMFPNKLITFTGEDYEMAGGSGNSKSEQEEEDSETDSGPSFSMESVHHNGHILANQYELVRTIFSYLPMRDLENCSKVIKKNSVFSYKCFMHAFNLGVPVVA